MSSINKILDPKNDFAFKKIFGTEKNEDILIHFLNDVIEFADNAKVESVTFLNAVQDPDIASKKESVVDVLCTDNLGRQHIVEIQVAKQKGFEKRAQYYAAKAYSGQLNGGDKYFKLKEVIFLAIANFVMFPDKAGYKSDHIILDKETYAHDLKDFSFTFLELVKFHKKKDELKTMTEKWCYFFKHAEHTITKDLDKFFSKDTVIKKAYQALEAANWTEAELNTYEKEQKRIRDLQAAYDYMLDKGKAEGETNKALEIARNMIAKGYKIEDISEMTGLSKEEIESLR